MCELPDETARRDAAWTDLVRYLRASPTDVVVLPEMPFCDWEMFRKRTVDLAAWRSALAAHDTMVARLGELHTGTVLASRPVELRGKRLNQAFAWTQDGGYRGARAKYYLPDEPDGWEASWFDRGDRAFPPESAGSVKVGFQLCTELLFSQAAWEIGQQGGQLIAAPRATGGHRRWPMAACQAAIMETLGRLKAQMTIVVAGHRLEALGLADHLVMLDKGQIVEQGPPVGLLFSHGLYRSLLGQAATCQTDPR